jgi:hypothetical protein
MIGARRRRLVPAVAVGVLLLQACTGGTGSLGTSGPPEAAPSPLPRTSFTPPPAGSDPLCDYPPPTPAPALSPKPMPPAVTAIQGQVAALRGLRFVRPVRPDVVTKERIAELLRTAVDAALPVDLEARRGRAWVTMGLLPVGTDLREAFLSYYTTQVIGYYDTLSHRLVIIGAGALTPYQRMTLSHELTHALDDQYFDLGRLDVLTLTCQDERATALSSLAEGDAVETSIEWAQRNLSSAEQSQLQQEAGAFPPPPSTIPPFVLRFQQFPYPNGERFVQALQARGGEHAVDEAFARPPVSTEQILHPDRYPSDLPVDVHVPDLAAALGPGWKASDQMDVGEGFLRLMLELRLPSTQADPAAAGWDGGRYLAWSDGTSEALVMDTVWDTDGDATEFVGALRAWLAEGSGTIADVERRSSRRVRVLFASDPPSLQRLRAVAAA